MIAQKSAVGRAAKRAERTRSAFPINFGRISAESTMPKSEAIARTTETATDDSNRVTNTELTTKYEVLTSSAPSIVPTRRIRGCANSPSTIAPARGYTRRRAKRSAGVSAK